MTTDTFQQAPNHTTSTWQGTAVAMYAYAQRVMGQDWVNRNYGTLSQFSGAHQTTFQSIASGKMQMSQWQRDFVADRLYDYAVGAKGQDWANQNYGTRFQFRANRAHFNTYNTIANGSYSYTQWTKDFTSKNPGGTTTTDPGGGSKDQKDAYATLLDTLGQYGLSDLADWLWKEILADKPASQIFIDLRKTDAYKNRFVGLIERQKLGLQSMSESEYIRTESDLRRTLKEHGVDLGTDPKAFLPYFAKDLSADEVSQRADIWYTMTKSPQTAARVKGLFEQFTGIGNITDDQMFHMLVENDSDLLKSLNHGLASKGVQTLSLDNLKSQIQKAMQTEAATWLGGGGQVAQQGGLKTGLIGSETERFA